MLVAMRRRSGYTGFMFLLLAKRLVRLSLFAPLMLAPFFIKGSFVFPGSFFFPFISLKVFFFRFMVDAALFSLIIHFLLSGTRKVQFMALIKRLKHPLAIAVIAFGVIFFITALLGENPGPSIWSNFERGEGAFQMLHYCLFFLLVFVLFTEKEEIRRLMKLNVVVSVLISLYAVTQLPIFNGAFGTIGTSVRISGTLGNPSYLAAYLLINFALIAHLFLTTKEKKSRGWLLGIAIFELLILLGTGTRAAYIALAVGALAIYLTTLIFTKDSKLRLRLLLVAIIGTVGLTGLVVAYQTVPALNNSYLLGRLLDVKSAVGSFDPRVWTWQSAIEGIKERPLLGWGAENFPYSFDKHYNPRHFGIESFFDRTHNIILEYLISGGALLLIAYLSIWFFFYRGLRGREKNIWLSILVATPIMYLVQGLFLFDVLPIYLMLFLFLATTTNLALPQQNTAIADDGYDLSHKEMLSSMIVLAGFLYLVIVTVVFPMKKNLLISKAYATPMNGLSEAFNAYQNAVIYPSVVGQEESISALTKFSVDFLETAVAQKVEVPREIVQGIVETNNSWFDQYRHTFAGARQTYLNGGLNLRAGLSFGFPEYTARGIQLYEDVLADAPTRIEFIKVLIDVALATGNSQQAENLLARGKELRPDLVWQIGAPATP